MIVYHVDQTLNGDLGRYPFNEAKNEQKQTNKEFWKQNLCFRRITSGPSRRKVWKPGGARSNVVGLMVAPLEIGLTDLPKTLGSQDLYFLNFFTCK